MQPSKLRLCGGRRKNGEPCLGPAMKGSATCRMHNGKRAGRPVTTGLYAEHLRGTVLAAVESSLNDPRLLEARQHIAPMVGIAKQQAARIQEGDGVSFRSRALELLRICREEAAKPDGNARGAIQDLFAHVEHGWDRLKAERDFFELLERVDRRTTEAQKLELSRQNAIPGAKLEDLMTALVAALNVHVDEQKRKAVLSDLSKTWGEQSNRVAVLLN